MPNRRHLLQLLGASTLGAATSGIASANTPAAPPTLLNVSFDVSREYFRKINAAFIAQQQQRTGQTLHVNMSHAGSSAQARAVADGLDADVVTMNTVTDIDFLAERGVVARDWRQRLPHNASPTTSTTLFVVRRGNPKQIRDWRDLIRPGVQVVVANPRTSGNGRMAYLAAWGFVRSQGGSDTDAAAFVRQLYQNVPVLARGGRDGTGAFLQRNIGDVLVTLESEVILVKSEFGVGRIDVVHPSISLLTENPVALVERTVNQRGSRALAQAYLEFLYSDAGQEIAASNHFRPRNPEVLRRHSQHLRPIRLFEVGQYFGSWGEAQRQHFADGGQFDQIFAQRR